MSESSLSVGQRISVIGTSGSGKTTLAQRLAKQCNIPHVELDALHWEPNWVEAPHDVFCQRISEGLKGDRWVVDGNYHKVRDLVWSRASSVVWLDYPFWVVLNRIVQRTLWRGLTRAELWNGNRESLQKALSKDSMILWMLKTYQRRRQEVPALLQRSEYSHLTVVHLKSPQATEAWLLSLKQASTGGREGV
jgi:adenylate kinase family enzyme